jgi:hypothetical protein
MFRSLVHPVLLLLGNYLDFNLCYLQLFFHDDSHSKQRFHNRDGAYQAGEHGAPEHKASCQVCGLEFVISEEEKFDQKKEMSA